LDAPRLTKWKASLILAAFPSFSVAITLKYDEIWQISLNLKCIYGANCSGEIPKNCMRSTSMAAKKLVYFDRFINPVGEENLKQHPDEVEMVKLSSQDPKEKLWEAMADAHGFYTLGRTMPETEEMIQKSPNLLGIVSGLAGFDTINVPMCTEAGILVCNQTGMGNEPVAEHVTAAMLMLSHRTLLADRHLHARIERKQGELTGNDLLGKTVGVVGFGAIGSRVGQILSAAFSMRVLVHDPVMGDDEIARRGGESVSLDELLKESDFVTIHVPLTDQTRGMIGEREYRLMKPTAFFINAARGYLYDEQALEKILKEGVIAGAALDVWETEPPSFDHPLLKLDNVLASPHSSGTSQEALYNMSENAGKQFMAIFGGERPVPIVNPEVWPAYVARYKDIMGQAPRG
jgi:D-3-phosphoglycerate dehydrogenase